MKVKDFLKFMYSGDNVKVYSRIKKTMFEGKVKEVNKELLNIEVVQIWSKDDTLILFIE